MTEPMEYQLIELSRDAEEATRDINEMAEDDWELLQIVPLPGRGDLLRVQESRL